MGEEDDTATPADAAPDEQEWAEHLREVARVMRREAARLQMKANFLNQHARHLLQKAEQLQGADDEALRALDPICRGLVGSLGGKLSRDDGAQRGGAAPPDGPR